MYRKVIRTETRHCHGIDSRDSDDGIPSSLEDDLGSCFHTPQHSVCSHFGSVYLAAASQGSIDIFHDARSTLSRCTPSNSVFNCSAEIPQNRKRHASSGGNADHWNSEYLNGDDVTENTIMLPKDPVEKIRHSSYRCGSRSCNSSPLHTTPSNPLKKGNSSNEFPNVGSINYVQCVEATIIEETKEAIKPSGMSMFSNLNGGPNKQNRTGSGMNEDWTNNYVQCVEMQPLHNYSPEPDDSPERSRNLINGNYQSKKIRRKRYCYCSEEFTTGNFGLQHQNPHLFVTSAWQKHDAISCGYLSYRLFWCLYILMWSVWSFVGYAGYNAPLQKKPYYFIYLTNCSMWMLSIDTLLQAVNVIFHMRKISQIGDACYRKMPLRLKISWFLSNISSIHIFIAVMFWIFIYPFVPQEINEITIHTHVVPACYVILDLFISSTPKRIFHFWHLMVYVAAYGTFSLVYFLYGGLTRLGDRSIYPFLDWGRPAPTLVKCAGVLLIAIPLLQTVVYLLFIIKTKLLFSHKLARYHDTTEETTKEDHV